jgi:GNAT superfamily N-acetyltransferase
VELRDKPVVESYLRRDVLLHIYGLGDLDDRFWPWTTWYGRVDGSGVRALAMVYRGLTLPTLLALGSEEEMPELRNLLRGLQPVLPARFYAHLSPRLADEMKEHYQLDHYGPHHKMGLTDRTRLPSQSAPGTCIIQLTQDHLPQVLDLYARSYPGNWFEAQMLETGHYYGLWREGQLASIAGVHTHSTRYRVAALGNITTDPRFRGQGCARAVTAQLCRQLLRSVEHIGLNVAADNLAALGCYRSLGFEIVADYDECMVRSLPGA